MSWPQNSPKSEATLHAAPKENKRAQADAAAAEEKDLQKVIQESGNDRAALVRNLEGFLKKYPESSQRPQIYRAMVESSLQLRDFTRATDYAERMVSLNPDDISNTVLSIQLLDRFGDVPGWRRAVFYCSRVMEQLEHLPQKEKSPRVSPEEWESEKHRDTSSLLLTRGDLYRKLNDIPNAQKDFEASDKLIPSAAAAERLGELAELNKDSKTAIQQYARAFALTEGSGGASSRANLRKKIGNAWRMAHGSEDGLGDYLLHAFDTAIVSTAKARPARNENAHEVYEFTLRKAPEGSPYVLADAKQKILVMNFWATWCGPCREMEPLFEKIASHFAAQKDVLFFAVNTDDDESLVPPYLEAEKPKVSVLYADGFDRLLGVNSLPTTIILDRDGKIAFRTDGFDPESVEETLTVAIDHALQAAAHASTAAAANAKP
ncbi:MAG TPA: redoxin family protein [Candidatus Acidoferrum sp.]